MKSLNPASTVRCLLIVIGFQAFSSSSKAQSVQLSAAPACRECRLTVNPVVTLDGSRGDYVDEPRILARMSDGRWLLSTYNAPTRVTVFDRSGRPQRTIGRSGEGPGEYRGIAAIQIGSGDTAAVYDGYLQRRTLLDSNLQFIRSERTDVQFVWDLEHLPDGSLIASTSIPTPQHAGLPLHIYDVKGSLVHSFGAEEPSYDFRKQDLLYRTIAPAHDRVWVAHFVQYRLEAWSYDGRRLQELVRHVPWFKPHDHAGMNFKRPQDPPNPFIYDVRYNDGLLWVLLRVPDPEYRKGIGMAKGMYSRALQAPIVPNDYYDSVIEVIDPRGNQVLHSQRFDAALRFIGESNFLFSYRLDEAGVPFIDVVEARFTRGSQR